MNSSSVEPIRQNFNIEELLPTIRKSIEAQLHRDGELLRGKVQKFIDDSVTRGVGVQGFTLLQLADICAESFDEQVTNVTRRIEYLLQNPYPTYTTGLASQLKKELRNFFGDTYEHYFNYLDGRQNVLNEQIRHEGLLQARRFLSERFERALTRCDADLERFGRQIEQAKLVEARNSNVKDEKKTVYDDILYWLKNRPYIAAIVLIGLVVPGIKSAIEAGVYLYDKAVKLFPYLKLGWNYAKTYIHLNF